MVSDRDYKELPIGLCRLDADLRYLSINDWLAAINGLTIEGAPGTDNQ